MKKMTIIYLGRKGAGPVYSIEMTKSLMEIGCQILAVISSNSENIDKWRSLARDNSNLALIEMQTSDSKIQILKSLILKGKYRSIVMAVKAFQPDCVYLPMISVYATFIVKQLSEFKILTTIHDVNQHLGEKNYIIDGLFNDIVRKSNEIITLSEKFIPEISRKYDIPEKHIHHIPHANFNYYRSNEKTHTPLTSERLNNRILFFGRIKKYKGLSILLKALRIVIGELPYVRLSIYGSGELTEEENKLLIELHNHIDLNLRWISENEIESIFMNIDLCVVPYVEASQSGVIPLSYSMGKGVIVSDIGGLSEQVNNKIGKLVQSNNPEELAKIIIDLYYNPARIVEMGKNALNYANEELSWKKSSLKLLQCI